MALALIIVNNYTFIKYMYIFAYKNYFVMESENLRKLINLFGKNSLYTLSWGINNMKEHVNGLEFHVQGFKYQGVVSISDASCGKYLVKVGNDEYPASYSNLIQIIDKLVESDTIFIR